ncbi:unnamed protein product [Paramecium primaurelia]|uniref:Uncharacterized protein n=1 Tax=Paramecium primaurelia TaxID=5886 RepID=A0A8S1L5E3_PARPR|nr:unnamed protein product [Paramecium primaurelia]
MQNRQELQSNPIFQQVCQKLNFQPDQLEPQDFEEFYQANQKKYNMDEEAWVVLWEGQEEKKQNKLQQVLKIVELEELKAEEEKKKSFAHLLIQLSQSQSTKIQQKQLEKLRAGNLKDLRFYVEQQISQLTNKKSFIPRYKEIDIYKERRMIEMDQERDKLLETKVLKFSPPLETKKKIDSNLVFVGLDKLAPRQIKLSSYEFDVENYDPEDDVNYELEQQLLDQIEEELRQGKRTDKNVTEMVRRPEVKKKKGDQIQEVQKRNQEQMEEKRNQLLEKQEKEEERIIQRQLQKQREQKQKIISNFMRQQDKKENQNRIQLVDELNNELLQKKIAEKNKKINKFQKNKSNYHKQKFEINRQLDDYDMNLNQLLEDYQDGIISANVLEQAISDVPVNIQVQKTQAQKVQLSQKKKSSKPLSQKNQQELIDLEQKHNLELRMLIEREELAELNRQKSINHGVSQEILELFEKQREASKKRIQNTLTKQKMEIQNKLRLYSKSR